MRRWIRIVVTSLTGLVGVSAVAGGLALTIGSSGAVDAGAVVPDRSFLVGSPFTSFLVPGIVLAVVVGGTHLIAAILVGRDSTGGPIAVAVAGFGLLVWIFVQMVFIPFSPLQAVYFGAGLAELGLLLLALGLLPVRTPALP
jgi:hypothetical protein